MTDKILFPLEADQAANNLISAWVELLELRDLETKEHTERVSELSLRLARRIGLNRETQEKIYFGARLHDIGKIGVRDSILLKNGPLTEEETAVIRQHPLLANKMLQDVPCLVKYVDIPLYHHERWDGKGYPYGRKGDEIPIEARLFSVIDAWDAITNDRPYRKALSQGMAIQLLKEESGTQFDPVILAEFIKLVEESNAGKVQDSSPLILVVEDDPTRRDVLLGLLIGQGYECRGARDGKEALVALEELTPDLILCEAVLPNNMNGFELKQTLTTISQELDEIPFFIFVDSRTSEETLSNYSVEIDDYLHRPFTDEDLLRKVKAIFRRINVVKRQEELGYARRTAQTQRAISHEVVYELKSSMGIVTGNLEIALRQGKDCADKQLISCLIDAKSGAQKLQRVIDDLLYLYKQDNHLYEDLTSKIDIEADVRTKIQKVVAGWQKKELVVRANLDDSLDFAAPHDGFILMLTHLLDSACKFARKGGQVELSLTRETNWVILVIENEGEKIPVTLQGQPFDHFVLPTESVRKYSGLGLDLSIAKGFVDSVDGTIEFLESAIGNRICVQIPLLTEEEYHQEIHLLTERAS